MSKDMDLLRSVNVYNDANFFQDEPYISYRAGDTGRASIISAWLVTKRGVNLQTHWTDYGSKSFTTWGVADRKVKFEDAKAYMLKKFGVTELKRAPTGGWGSAEYVDKRMKEIKELANKL